MKRVFTVTLVGLIVVSAVPPSALAFHCVARSTNGASGWANRAFLGRAQRVALRACIAAGGNLNGGQCHMHIVAEGRSIQVAI